MSQNPTNLRRKEKQAESVHKLFLYFKFVLAHYQENLSRIERGSSYILSFFGAILPLTIFFLEPAKDFLLHSIFAPFYLLFYLGVVIAAIISLFPLKSYRAFQLKMSIPDISTEDFEEKIVDSEKQVTLDITNKIASTMLTMMNKASIKGEYFAKLSYYYLLVLFVYFGADLIKKATPRVLTEFIESPITFLIIFLGPTIYITKNGFDEWKRVK